MNIFEDTNPRALKDLLAEVHNRVAVLPDFQRDFVWEPSATQELIVSIANNYPAGSILRVRDTKRIFAAREFEGAPTLDGTPHTFLVLDGQQRLTSLYQAFFGVGDHRYYLDLHKLSKDANFEEAIFHFRTTTKWVQKLESFEAQAAQLTLPLSVLKGGAGGYLGWVLKVTNPMEPAKRTEMLDVLTKLNDEWIKTIDDYHFPVVTLSASTEPDALCTIFETLNRTGVKLSVFELLTARFWPQGINLRALWEKAQSTHPIIDHFEVDRYYVLQAIALASGSSPACKRSDILNLTAKQIDEWWDKAVHGLALGLTILRDDCGVIQAKWLPYQPMLPTLAAVLAKTGNSKTADAAVLRKNLTRWFWCAVFGQSYESAANSQSARDYAELIAWLTGGLAPGVVSTLHFDPKALHDVTPRQRSIYRGTICLILASKNTRDFHTGSAITSNLMEEQGIHDHHVFPADYLKSKKGISSVRERDCVLNRTLIDRTTNLIISNRAPSDYLAKMRNTKGFPFETVLASHCLPAEDSSPLLKDDYPAFLAWRRKELWALIKGATGLSEATDLEASEE